MSNTRGPWVEFSDQGDTIAIMPAGREGDVCKFAHPYPARPDARLIATAPDLLEELKQCAQLILTVSTFQDDAEVRKEMKDQVKRARAVILKATATY